MKIKGPDTNALNKMNFAHKAMTFVFRGHKKEFDEIMKYPIANNGCFSRKVDVKCECEK